MQVDARALSTAGHTQIVLYGRVLARPQLHQFLNMLKAGSGRTPLGWPA